MHVSTMPGSVGPTGGSPVGGGKGKAVVAVAHEMIRIVYFMLRDNAPYRGQNVELTLRKLKNIEGRSSIGLRI